MSKRELAAISDAVTHRDASAHIMPLHVRAYTHTHTPIPLLGEMRPDASLRHFPSEQADEGIGPALEKLAGRVRRLVPSHRDPEAFHEAKSEIEAELRHLAEASRQETCAPRGQKQARVLPHSTPTGPAERETSPDLAGFDPKLRVRR